MVFGERRHAEVLRDEVAAVLAPLGLRLSLEKTRVVHIDEGFVFLGMHIRRQRKRGTQKYYVYTKPSKVANQSIKDKLKAKTYRSTRAVAQKFDGKLGNPRLDVYIPLPNASLARSFQDVTLGRDLGAYDENDKELYHLLCRSAAARRR